MIISGIFLIMFVALSLFFIYLALPFEYGVHKKDKKDREGGKDKEDKKEKEDKNTKKIERIKYTKG
jgi:flagellar biosynthesis component FlhA